MLRSLSSICSWFRHEFYICQGSFKPSLAAEQSEQEIGAKRKNLMQTGDIYEPPAALLITLFQHFFKVVPNENVTVKMPVLPINLSATCIILQL